MKRTLTSLIGAALLTAAIALPGQANAQDKKPIIIGAAVALSGFMNQYDDGPMKAAQLAIDDINASGGVLGRPLVIITVDTKTDPAQAARAGIEVLGKGAEFVITSCDFDFGGPAALAAQAQGVLVFSTCTADPKFGVQGIGNMAFTMNSGTPAQGAIMAEWAFKKKGFRSAYVLTDTIVEYTKSVCAAFKDRWIEIAGEDALAGEDTFFGNDLNVQPQITRFKANSNKPEFIYYCSGGPGGPAALRQIRAAGIDVPILSADAMDGDYWLESVPNLSEFYYPAAASIFGDDPRPAVQDFLAKYKAAYGDKPPTAQALTGYAVIQAFAIAAERAGSTDGDALRKELEKFKGESLIIGPTTYSAELHIDLTRPMTIMQIQGGKPSAVEEFKPEKVPAPKF